MIRRASETKISPTLRYLARTIERRCLGRTLILGRGFPELMQRLESNGIEVQTAPLEALGDSPDREVRAGGREGEQAEGSFDTVVLVRAIEYGMPDSAREHLHRAWRRIAPRGRMLICVPNEGHLEDPDLRQRFTRRGLKKLLKTIDQPKIFTDQPFGWLFMSVTADPRTDRTNERRHRVIAELCRGEVLELGCGVGQLSAKIAEGGLTVVGVDRNAAKISKARRLFPGIVFEQHDILELPLRRRYDTVVLAEVLEHVPEDAGAAMLSKAWELVSPGGRLVVSVPNEDCVRHANHLREFTHVDLIDLLRPFGQPTLVTDQPFKWLLAYVDRPV